MAKKAPVVQLLANLPDDLAEERFERLAGAGAVEIERIVSRGHASPPGFWYDQERTEWVLVLAGRAGLEIEREPEIVELGPGDSLELPARVRHRVAWTADEGETIWLAVHYPPSD